jgi:hypothetical protein
MRVSFSFAFLFVPYIWYVHGYQMGESLYHYLAGVIFRDMCFLVYDEYCPSIVSARGIRTDVSAFKSEELDKILSSLRAKGIISSGAFQDELQMFSIFGKQKFKARSLESPQSRPLLDIDNRKSIRTFLKNYPIILLKAKKATILNSRKNHLHVYVTLDRSYPYPVLFAASSFLGSDPRRESANYSRLISGASKPALLIEYQRVPDFASRVWFAAVQDTFQIRKRKCLRAST